MPNKYELPTDRKPTLKEKRRYLGYDKSTADAPEFISPPPPDVSARSQFIVKNNFEDIPLPSSRVKVLP